MRWQLRWFAALVVAMLAALTLTLFVDGGSHRSAAPARPGGTVMATQTPRFDGAEVRAGGAVHGDGWAPPGSPWHRLALLAVGAALVVVPALGLGAGIVTWTAVRLPASWRPADRGRSPPALQLLRV